MAQVVRLHEPRPGEIDNYLTYLSREWGGIPELAAEWHEWDEWSKVSFSVDWPICEDRLFMLRTWAAAGKLTPDQCQRYDELLKLIEAQRPTLERLLAD